MNLDRIFISGFLFVGGTIFSYQRDFGFIGLLAMLLGGIPLLIYWWKTFAPIINYYITEDSDSDTQTKEDNHEDP